MFDNIDARLMALARSLDRATTPRNILCAATALYPHIAVSFPSPEDVGAMKVGADITEIDKARALRAVDLAFGMEQVIRARIERGDRETAER
jgi:hypothetical protein